jgi:hypothetical protein
MKEIHIVAGMLALLTGFVAAFAAKGSRTHRLAGLGFVVAMFTMTSSALVAAAFLRPNAGNVVAATFTLYLVATAFLTVHPVPQQRGVQAALVAVGLAAGFGGILLGWDVLGRRPLPDGIPGQPLIVFGAIALVGALSDLRLLDGRVLDGSQRLMRHLWRMLLALWVATGSAFLGQMQFLPDAITRWWLQLVPVLAITALLVYWPVRIARQRRRAQRAREVRGAAVAQAV